MKIVKFFTVAENLLAMSSGGICHRGRGRKSPGDVLLTLASSKHRFYCKLVLFFLIMYTYFIPYKTHLNFSQKSWNCLQLTQQRRCGRFIVLFTAGIILSWQDGPLRSAKESRERDTEKVVIVLSFFSDSVENLPRQKTGQLALWLERLLIPNIPSPFSVNQLI